MMRSMTTALAAAAALGGLALESSTASAIPMVDRAPAAVAQAAAAENVDHVRMVCGPFGCHWRPDYYRPYPVYGFGYGPRYGYGWRHHHHHRYHGYRRYGYRHDGYRW